MFGLRLKEERARLGLTQPQLAEAVGVAKRTVVDWEQEKSSPTAKQLMIMNSLDIDTNYLLIGQRSSKITTEEQVILDKYREATTETRNKVLMTLLGAKTDRKTTTIHGGHNAFDGGTMTINHSQAGFTDLEFAIIGAICGVVALIFGGFANATLYSSFNWSVGLVVLEVIFLALTVGSFILSHFTENVVPSKKWKEKNGQNKYCN